MGETGEITAKQLREWLQSTNAPKKVIVSCRAENYKKDFDLNLFTVLVNEMSITTIERFAVNYLGDSNAKRFLSKIFPKDLSDTTCSRSLAAIAANPYFLAALIYIYQNTSNSELPTNTGILFQALVKALWAREQRNQTTGWVPFEKMESAFSLLV
jgi:hypothetical protein